MSLGRVVPSPPAGTPKAAASGEGLIGRLRGFALRGLAAMYRPEERLFVFRVRRTGSGVATEGLSRRYTAIALIGLAGERPDEVASVLAGGSPRDVCGGLMEEVCGWDNLGDVALALWAGHAVGRVDSAPAFERLVTLRSAEGAHPTVELAWTLVALCAEPSSIAAELRDRVARRLIGSFATASNVFPHMIGAYRSGRSHICCFADLVYPIHALSRYYLVSGERAALDAARRGADRICRLQGPAGQWWWHYDCRTGRVVESYPVYAVHQDAMAPMALFALQEASGGDYSGAIRRGLDWLASSPELGGGTLVDVDAGFIWRKVARREPGKLSRYVQALATLVHPSLRAPGLDLAFPPGAVDDEDRPYHLGWLLYAFPPGRAAASW